VRYSKGQIRSIRPRRHTNRQDRLRRRVVRIRAGRQGRRVDLGSSFDQGPHRGEVPRLGREQERRAPLVIAGLDRRFRVDQVADRRRVAASWSVIA
jgi:hypothetical protein